MHVDGDAGCGVGDGSEGDPYCSLGEALGAVGAESLIVLHEQDFDVPYVESNSVAVTVVVFAAAGESPTLQGGGGSPALTVSASGDLIVRDVEISGGPVTGITVNGGHAWLEKCVVADNGSEGLRLSGGEAWVQKSQVVNNDGGGIVVDGGGMLVAKNSFVGGNVTDVPALDVLDGTAEIIYSTLGGGAIASNAIVCMDGVSVLVRNSLLVSRQAEDEVVCPNIMIEDSALEMGVAGNVALGDMDTVWFINYQEGNLHLAPGMYPAEIETAATWSSGDPALDIDGDSRPMEDGSLDFAGADRVP